MKHNVIAITSAMLVLMSIHPVVAGDTDKQLWCDARASFDAKGLAWLIEEEVRIADDISDAQYFHTDIGVTYPITSWFDAGLNYREIQIKGNEWQSEHRPHINGTFKWSGKDWNFTDRNRLEYRMYDEGDNECRYRNKISVFPPISLTSIGIKPFLACELFIETSGDGLSQKRFFAGVTAKPTEHLLSELSYMRQSHETHDDWIDADVITVALTAVF
jgi:hypothetical protein